MVARGRKLRAHILSTSTQIERNKQTERQTKRVNYGEAMSLQTPQMANFQPDSKF